VWGPSHILNLISFTLSKSKIHEFCACFPLFFPPSFPPTLLIRHPRRVAFVAESRPIEMIPKASHLKRPA